MAKPEHKVISLHPQSDARSASQEPPAKAPSPHRAGASSPSTVPKDVRQRYRFSLKRKLVLGVVLFSAVTYGTSAFFLFVLDDFFTRFLGAEGFTVLTLFLGVVWMGIFGYAAAGRIVRPLNALDASARTAATGDLRVTVDVPASRDEVQTLAASFAQMVDNLRQMVGNVARFASETEQRVDAVGRKVQDVAEQADVISRNVEEIARGAEQVAQAIQRAAEAVDAVARMAQESEEKANDAKEQAEAMRRTLDETGNAVRQLVQGLQTLALAGKQVAAEIERLQERSRAIAGITDIVGELARQTNLLALNASIEAAVPGSRGGGLPLWPTRCASWPSGAPRRYRRSTPTSARCRRPSTGLRNRSPRRRSKPRKKPAAGSRPSWPCSGWRRPCAAWRHRWKPSPVLPRSRPSASRMFTATCRRWRRWPRRPQPGRRKWRRPSSTRPA
nr:methyl-accepting chemotaxis protein [Calditerricola satsumensis]